MKRLEGFPPCVRGALGWAGCTDLTWVAVSFSAPSHSALRCCSGLKLSVSAELSIGVGKYLGDSPAMSDAHGDVRSAALMPPAPDTHGSGWTFRFTVNSVCVM